MSCKNASKAAVDAAEPLGSVAAVIPDDHEARDRQWLEAAQLVYELDRQYAALIAAESPYQERIAAINAKKRQALAELDRQEKDLENFILGKAATFDLAAVEGGGLALEVNEHPGVDSAFLRSYHANHPGSFLVDCMKKVTPRTSFYPATGAPAAQSPKEPEKSEYERKVARNQAITTARRLVDEGFVLIDTETTGLGARDEVVSIGVVGKDFSFYSLVKPTVPIKEEAAKVHGIGEEEVANAPTMAELMPKLKELIGDRHLVAYNAPFDRGKILQSARANGVDTLPGGWSCAMRLYADFASLEKYSKLGDAADAMGIIDDGKLHNAETDARLAYQLVERMAACEIEPIESADAKAIAWDEPNDPAEAQAYAETRTRELLGELARLRQAKAEAARPFEAQARAIEKEMKAALDEPLKTYQRLEKRAKDAVLALGETVYSGGGARITYALTYTWDYPAILRYMREHPDSDFCQEAAAAGFKIGYKRSIGKARKSSA